MTPTSPTSRHPLTPLLPSGSATNPLPPTAAAAVVAAVAAAVIVVAAVAAAEIAAAITVTRAMHSKTTAKSRRGHPE